MEEIDQEARKHLCKLCNKCFPCGRSLGGHMRSHMINSSNHDDDHHHEVKNETSSSVLDKICKECGKGFQSWKALFGHMKCHSMKVSNNKNKNIACLGQNLDAKYRQVKRSRSGSRPRNMRKERYIVASTTTAITSTSSISMNANNNNQLSSNNASTSMVSEIEDEQEQEADVAISLMMLSRDSGKWGNEFESYDYYNSSVLLKLNKVEGKNLSQNVSRTKKFDFLGKPEVGSIKSFDFGSFGEFEDSSKRKFACVTCNKSFHSYQALGGHKASHNKLKGDFNLKTQNENKIEHKPMLDYDQTVNGYDSKTSNGYQESTSFNLEVGFLKKKKVVSGVHECPICFKIFSSGQALGGHKRAHLVSEAKLNQENNMNVIHKPDGRVCETRGFLDLNMLPEEEEEMNMSNSTTEYKSYYWEESSDHHSHEPRLLGLLSTT
ncbi:zinc finger, C2H2-like protein [Artemisia annua]|uniref:Zinc finger, C2H2-like protein n=1 Tax=Artemisia annua TaxID=35608 RepID=A0A2U1NRJ0_ARTAN|nr:zinc finger, C2H2-like protein [Artemisia annua]